MSKSKNRRIVNQVGLAEALNVSARTIRQWLRDYPDFPVESRGSEGRPYRFSVAKVKAWLAKREARIQAEIAAKWRWYSALGQQHGRR